MADSGEHVAANPNTAYEPSDWPIGWIALLFVLIFVFLVAATLVLVWAYTSTLSDVARTVTVKLPAPVLQTNPAEDLAKFQVEEKKKLETYYWIDKQKGIVHIPIEEAMKKVVKEGIDGFPKASP